MTTVPGIRKTFFKLVRWEVVYMSEWHRFCEGVFQWFIADRIVKLWLQNVVCKRVELLSMLVGEPEYPILSLFRSSFPI